MHIIDDDDCPTPKQRSLQTDKSKADVIEIKSSPDTKFLSSTTHPTNGKVTSMSSTAIATTQAVDAVKQDISETQMGPEEAYEKGLIVRLKLTASLEPEVDAGEWWYPRTDLQRHLWEKKVMIYYRGVSVH